MRLRNLTVGVVFTLLIASAARADDLNTRLTLCTFKIANPSSTATAFILTRPSPEDPWKPQHILVTAGHVFAGMRGDEATVWFRKLESDGSYTKRPATIRVRKSGKELWTKHPSVDAAVMVISVPKDISLPAISPDVLATDEDLKKYEIHPGDSIRSIGYPHANQFEANAAGFPVVRMGCISSFPLLPTARVRTFLYDTNVFEGISGGPVYLSESNRYYAGKSHNDRVEMILGLNSGQHWLNESYNMVYESGTVRQRLELAIAVHASAIRETIDLLPRMATTRPATKPTTLPATRPFLDFEF